MQRKEDLKFYETADKSIMCSTQILVECITKIMRFQGKTIYDRASYNEEMQWKILRSNDEKRLQNPLQLHQPCLHKEKCQQRPKTPLYSQEDHI